MKAIEWGCEFKFRVLFVCLELCYLKVMKDGSGKRILKMRVVKAKQRCKLTFLGFDSLDDGCILVFHLPLIYFPLNRDII